MPSAWDVSAEFRLMVAIKVILWGLFFLYLSFRKKLRFMFYLSITFLIDGITRYTLTDIVFSTQLLISIGLIVIAMTLGWKDFSALDQARKAPRDTFKPDWIDWVVVMSFLIGWKLIRTFVFEK